MDIANAIYDLGPDVFLEAETERGKSESSYEKWSKIFYGFYVIGSVVGLLGIMIGERREEPSTED